MQLDPRCSYETVATVINNTCSETSVRQEDLCYSYVIGAPLPDYKSPMLLKVNSSCNVDENTRTRFSDLIHMSLKENSYKPERAMNMI